MTTSTRLSALLAPMTRDAAWSAYRALLDRRGNPHAGDDALLDRLMRELDITPDDVRQHVAALDEVARLTAGLEGRDAVHAKVGPAQQARDEDGEGERRKERAAETRRIVTEREREQARLDAAAAQAYSAFESFRNIERDLRHLRLRHRRLFGLPPRDDAPAEPRDMIHTEIMPSGPVAHDRSYGPYPGENDIR